MDRDENASQTSEAIFIRRFEVDEITNPSVPLVNTITLRNSPKVLKSASYYVIRDINTGKVHHHSLTIKTQTKTIVAFFVNVDLIARSREIKPIALIIWGAGIMILSLPKLPTPVAAAPRGTIKIQAMRNFAW